MLSADTLRRCFDGHGCALVEAWGAPCMRWLVERQFATMTADGYVYDFADGQAALQCASAMCDVQATLQTLAMGAIA